MTLNLQQHKIDPKKLRTKEFTVLVQYLHEHLNDMREQYENNPADECTRGKILMLRDLLRELEQ